jgi:GrpB-like predicted nucleotidyltransferase (UPF0157 family)
MSDSPQYTDEKLAKATVGERKEHNSTIELAEYDANWPLRYREIEGIVRDALGDKVVLIEHVGSTSVPGLAAKPIIDIVLEVPDSEQEIEYVLSLENKGFWLRIREPDWHKHRLLKLDDVNLHVFSAECTETIRMMRFRNWLRSHPHERDLYQAKKRELAARVWKQTQNYADAKTVVVEAIISRSLVDEPVA